MKVRFAVRVWVVAIAAWASALGPGAAQEATPTDRGAALSPDSAVDGLALGEWSARSWQWFFSLPEEVNPYTDDTGERCGYGQSGPVFFLAAADHDVARACVVPAGTYLFVPLLGSECSTVESPPFFGRDEAELRRCAVDAVDHAVGAFGLSGMRLSVDGQNVGDLSGYRAATPLMTLWLPADNPLGSSRQTADSVADGYQVLLRPLPPGEHEVVGAIPGPEPGQAATVTYRLTVASGAYTPSATPASAPST